MQLLPLPPPPPPPPLVSGSGLWLGSDAWGVRRTRGAGAAGADTEVDAADGAEDKGNLRVLVLTFFLRNRLCVGAPAVDPPVDVLPVAALALGFCDAPPGAAAAAPDPDTGGKDRRGIGLEETDAAILEAAARAAGLAGAAIGATGGSFLRGMLFMIILAGGLPSFESGFMVTE
jgi:hypothetical protein